MPFYYTIMNLVILVWHMGYWVNSDSVNSNFSRTFLMIKTMISNALAIGNSKMTAS